MGGWTWDNWDVYVMDVNGSKVTRLTHKNYREIDGIEFSLDGNSILFSADNDRASKELYRNVFSVALEDSGSPKPGVPQPTSIGKYAAWASQPDLSSDGKKLVVVSDRAVPYYYDLVLIDEDSGDASPLATTGISHYNQQPLFTPDGRRILFLAARQQNAGSRAIFSLWSIDIDGKNAKEIASSQLFTDPLKWSPPN